MCRQPSNWNIIWKTLWTTSTFLLVLRTSPVTGVNLLPCGSEGIKEIFYNQSTSFNCTAEGQVQWRIHNGSKYILLSSCGKGCVEANTFGGLFRARRIDSQTSTLTVNPVNSTTLYNWVQVLNGSLECILNSSDNRSARCGLDYVYPAEGVVCNTSVIGWSVSVSCDIRNIYSSRRLYKCQLYRHCNKLQQVSLETVANVTSPNGRKIAKNEEQMSGVCQFNTRLPALEGNYSFSMNITPGRQHFYAGEKEIQVVRPTSATVLCTPQSYVLENSEVSCTCSTTSLGQPAGLVTWTIGNQTSQRKTSNEDKRSPKELEIYYTQTLTLSDHDNTWLRCDVIWGTETVKGENYTAKVGYVPRKPRLSAGGTGEVFNLTVTEGDLVHFECESDGRPTPTVHIYRLDNNIEVWSGSSPGNHTFVARCEDAATYKCRSKNEFSTQSNMAASDGFDLYVRCKPRNISIVDLGVVTFGNKTEKLNFDLMVYPVPHEYTVWFVGRDRNNSETISSKAKNSELNVTCRPHIQHRYLSSCTLEIFRVPSETGFYKVQVINDDGDHNFTVKISYGKDYDEPETVQITVYVSVAAAVVFTLTVVMLIVVIVRKKKIKESSKFERILSTNSQNVGWNSGNDEGGQPVQTPELIYENPWDTVQIRTRGLEAEMGANSLQACQTPLYAVVNKIKKTSRKAKKDKEHSESLQQDTNAIYAVVDKSRGKTPAKRAKGQRADKDQCPKTKKDQWNEAKPGGEGASCTGDSESNYVNQEHLAMHLLSSQSGASGMRNVPRPTAPRHGTGDGRWGNDDGLIYTLPAFDVRNEDRRPPSPGSNKTDYCTLRVM